MASTRDCSICATFRCRSLISQSRRPCRVVHAFKNEIVQKWTAAIAQSDGFVIALRNTTTVPPPVLKNAIDWVYPEWHRKAVSFVSYGSAGGVRSVQQLRETAIEVQLAPIRSSSSHPGRPLCGSTTRAAMRPDVDWPSWMRLPRDDRGSDVVDHSS